MNLKSTITSAVLLFTYLSVYSQQCDPRIMVDTAEILFDGVVNKMITQDHFLYAGGDFKTVGKYSGSFVEIDKLNGSAVNLKSWPKINGTASGITDGSGNRLVFGSFTKAGDSVRNNLAVINSAGVVTPLKITIDSAVTTAVVYNGVIYLGGYFTKINGQTRNKLAAINISTGALTSWDPNIQNTGPLRCRIECMTEINGILYVGGAFSHIGATARRNIGAININTGQANFWAPGAFYSTAPTYGNVSQMLKVNDLLYICGGFDQVGTSIRTEVAAIDINSGIPTAWDPKPNSVVLSLANKGDTVYIGGSFYEISGQPRSGFAAYSKNTGNLLPLKIDLSQKIIDKISAMCSIGDSLFIGGSFDTIAGQFRKNLAVFNRLNAAPLSFLCHTNRDVRSFTLDQNKLYIGGDFFSVKRKARNRFAQIDMDVDTATDWSPRIDGEIKSMNIYKNTLYISGYFNKINDSTRKYNAAIDIKTRQVNKWHPQVDSIINTRAIYNNNMYIGGIFKTIEGQVRNGIALLDSTGRLLPWTAIANTGSIVTAMEMLKDTLYVGGTFTDLGGQPRNCLGAINMTTGLATAWHAGNVYDVTAMYRSYDTLFVGGILPVTIGMTLFYMDAFYGYYLPKRARLSWGAPTYFDAPINDILVTRDFKAYLVGAFSQVKGSFTRKNMCIFNLPVTPPAVGQPAEPSLEAFDPNMLTGPLNSIYRSGNRLYVGGRIADMSIGYHNAAMFYIPGIIVKADITTDTNGLCSGIKTTVRANSTVTYGAIYNWFVNGLKVTNALPYYTFVPKNKDSVSCVVLSPPNTCLPDWQDTTNNIVYQVTPTITPDITISGPVEEEPGKTVTIKAVIKDADTGYTIEWFNRGVSMGKTKIDSISYTKGTGKDSIYAVITPRTDTCYITDTSSWAVVNEKDVTGIYSVKGGDERVVIYPNPFDTYLKIKGVEQGDVLFVYDVMGRKIFSTAIKATNTEYLLSTSALNSGTYVLKLTDKEGIPRKTILLQKQ